MVLRAVASAETAPPSELPANFPNWESRIYQYEFHTAMEAGFAVGSVKAEGAYRLLVMDTVRSATVAAADSVQQWGYGYRFLVEVSDVTLVGKLSLPAISAAMEITSLEAAVRLEVKGYDSPEMWGVIPAPKPLDVDTYKTYLTAVENIQKAFLDHPDKAFPVLLAKGGPDDIDLLIGGIDGADLEASIVLVWSLRQIASGAPVDVASATLSESDLPMPERARALVTGAYAAFVGRADPSTEPDDAARARAQDLLAALDYG